MSGHAADGMSTPAGGHALGFTGAVWYHLANGIRHLVWDTGRGLNPKLADMTGIAVILFAVLATAATWFAALQAGAL